jgi:hypothetical protein
VFPQSGNSELLPFGYTSLQTDRGWEGLLQYHQADLRIGNNQSLFDLSIICLSRKYFDEEKVVRYGLEPLTKAGILTDV